MKWLSSIPRSIIVAVLVVVFADACASLGGTGGGQDGSKAGISVRGAIGRLYALTGPLWTGDGGTDIRLAVLAPEARGGALF
jgi:hypothetical protein